MSDTIFALATAPGKAGVAVIRISGPQALAALGVFGVQNVPERRATLRRLMGADGQLLDEALVIRFASGESFTGEDVVELQTHGSVAIIKAVMAHLSDSGLARLARPGEFTRRALQNDRLDLTEVQGLADVIDAETEVQRREAMRVFGGEMSRRLNSWRATLIRAMALLEATIDFADEDVPVDVRPEVAELLSGLRTEMSAELEGVSAAQSLRNGFEVALVGAPNVGKSSLLNYIARTEASIVSDIAGTTRDIVEKQIDIRGLKVYLLDTAGIRNTSDDIEKIGVERAVARANAADLRVFLYEDTNLIAPLGVVRGADDITVRTKVDQTGGVGLSVVSGAGISELVERIGAILEKRVQQAGFVSRARDEEALTAALAVLERVAESLNLVQEELLAEDLRGVAHSLSEMIGDVNVEGVLDEVFRSFCLGK